MVTSVTPVDDASWRVLNETFGINGLGSILHGDKVSALQSVFYYFNIGLLSAVVMIYSFIVIIGTINSAKDGTFLGKNWDSYWIPIRVILGSSSVIPLKSGYCLAQYLVFVIVSSSISFADFVWQRVNADIAHQKLPPVISSDIADGIKSDLANYMLLSLSQQVVTYKEAKNICQTEEAGTYECKMPLQADMNAATMIQLATAMATQEVFKPYYTYLKQGMSAWSVLGDENYVQMQVADIVYNAIFDIHTTIINNADVEHILYDYAAERTKVDPILSYIRNPLSDIPGKAAFFDVGAGAQSLSDATQTIIKGLENRIKEQSERGQQSQSKGVSTDTGWWDADQEYIDLDKEFSQILSQFYAQFSVFDSISNSQINRVIEEKTNSFNVSYFIQSLKISDLYAYDIQLSTQPNQSQKQVINNIAVQNNGNGDSEHQYLAFSMQQVQKTLIAVLEDYTKVEKNYCQFALSKMIYGMESRISCEDLVKDVIPDDMSFNQGQYLFIIDNILSSERKSNQINIIGQRDIALSVLSLMQFFKNNFVSFMPNTKIDKDESSAASQFLKKMFEKMSISGSISDGSILSEIYSIGDADFYSGDNPVKNHFSMLQQIQGVGIAIMQSTIDTMFSIFGEADSKFKTFEIQAGILQAISAGASVAASAAWGSSLGAALATIGQTGIQVFSTLQMYQIAMSFIWLPIIFFVLVALFGIAVLFALVIPLTPFILFWAGKVAWLLLLIEALIAAPVMALGIVYPEGHEVFGKAEPGIQLMLNLVLRPVLMIAGLLAGIVLTYVVVSFSAEAFHVVASQLSDYFDNRNLYVSGSFSMILVFMYASFIALAFNKCFSLIYALPDKVLQWVGGGANEQAGVADMQEMKSKSEQYASGLSQAGTQTVDQGVNNQKQQASGIDQLSKDGGKSLTEHGIKGTESYKTKKADRQKKIMQE